MCKKNVLTIAAVAILALSASAGAAAITIVNPGFEDPVLADGDYNWLHPGWGWFGTDAVGSWNPGLPGTAYPGYGGNAPEGENIGFAEPIGGFAQVLTETLTAGMTYTLTVEVGYYAWGGYKVQLLAGGTPGDTGKITVGTLLAEDNNLLTIAEDTFETSTVTYTYNPALHSGSLGDPLQIRLLALGGDEADFDDVSLSYYVALPPGQATNPNPADGATDVCPKVVLSWTPGAFVGALSPKHKVFLSENFDDVNDGVGGVTQDPNRYPATGTLSLDFGKTYYWKVDEANSTTGWDEGGIWQFTTGPIAYPIAGDKITAATASSSMAADEGPENTINGSGLDANDLHSTVETDMWLSSSHQPGEAWIKYEFDKVYKLHEMWVWNYNTGMEDVLGYGLKDVTIEYSENGTDYTTLGTAHEFARAPGEPGYEHNTEVYFGVAAKYVRLTANSNWVGIFDKYGLSEVRFFCIPVRAREPNPEDGTTGVWPDVVLSWKPGRGVVEHNVYISEYFDDVNDRSILPVIIPADDLCQGSYGPLSLEFGKTYYWRIDGVEADSVTVHRGEVWSFRTKLFIPITDPNLIGWWKLDEGEGTVALDWSGHDNHGVLFGDPLWVAGIIGDALEFDGVGDYVLDGDAETYLNGLDALTVSVWVKSNVIGTDRGFIIFTDPDGSDNMDMRYDAAGVNGGGTNLIKCGVTSTGGRQQLESSSNTQTTEWQHLVMTWSSGNQVKLFINGVEDMPAANEPAKTGTLTGYTKLIIGKGGKDTAGTSWNGLIDDVRIYDKALTEAEIGRVMSGAPHLAWNPNPRDGAMVSFELAALSWSPGDEAVSHDVYFGTDEAAVASATLASPEFKANQTDTTYPLAELEMETTYYWRIDEVSDADTWKGDIWSFTTGKVYYVDADATGYNNGSSWVDAYWCLRNALTDAQAGDEIRVAEGMYRPDRRVVIGRWPIIVASGDRNATFQLKNGVAIKGGYAGYGQPDPNARDIDAYEAILSGDLLGNDGPDFANNGENSYNVVTGSGTNATAVLDGFTITGGNANESSAITGGLISHWKFDEGSGTIAYDSAGSNHGTVYGAQWTIGQVGGALDFDGFYDYVNCGNDSIFDITDRITLAAWTNIDTVSSIWAGIVTKGNSAWRLSTLLDLRRFHFAVASPSASGNWFVHGETRVAANEWHHVCGTYDGANIRLYVDGVEDTGSPVAYSGNIDTTGWEVMIGTNSEYRWDWNGLIDDVRIYGRALSAEEIQRLYSMGEGREYGGGMYNNNGNPTLTNCTFSENSAGESGGGMYNQDGSSPTVTNCTFSGNSAENNGGGMDNSQSSSPTLTNCTFIGNSAINGSGGGMDNWNGSNTTLTNCTFSGNSAGEYGGGIYNEASSSALTNCILWGNIDSGGMDESAQISGAAILNYCCIQGYVEPNEPSTQGLISHWKFDEGDGSIAYDSAGNNDGTIYGAEWTTGQIDGVLSFDGIDDYVDVGYIGECDELSIALWVNIDSLPHTWNSLFHNNGWESGDVHFIINGGGTVQFALSGNGPIDQFSNFAFSSSTFGKWFHIAVVYRRGLRTVDFYINGQHDVQHAYSGARSPVLGPLRIGGWNWEARNFHGQIDDLCLYNRALSAEEIEQLYHDGSREGQGNIGAAPWFVEPGYWDANGVWVDGDYHLLPGSPCINAGDPNYIAEPNETDLDGKPRVIGGRIDMGAYEYPNTTPVACIVGSNRIVEAQGPFGARITLDSSCSSDSDSTPGTNDDIVSFDWYKVDPCDPNFEDFLASGEIIDCNLPLGEHIIVLEVIDKAGAFDTNEVTIIVQDTTPPDFMLSVTPTMLWPANHKMVQIRPSWTVSDICDDSPEVSLVSITMNEGDEAKGDGNTAGDIQIGDDGSIYLRAERSGTGSGRIYTITYQAVDDSGNAAVARATVTVPHDQR